nr:hypothetical protein [Armatimonadota bacterium]
RKRRLMTYRRVSVCAVMASAIVCGMTLSATAAPVAMAGYSVSVFAPPPNGATSPDSIAIDRGRVFVGYTDQSIKTGGGTSTIAEFTTTGSLLTTFAVPGHNDGLKVDPATHLLWAMSNEDGNPQLTIIDPAAGTQTTYNLPSVNGGGLDDIVFLNGNVYFSVSNPANNPNTDPAIVQATLTNGAFTLTPVIQGNETAINVLTNTALTLNLQDPDSMTVTPQGNILLDSQADDQLVTVSSPGSTSQTVNVLPITINIPAANKMNNDIDDTVFARSADDVLLEGDLKSNNVIAISGLQPGQPYSASSDNNLVGALDLSTGIVNPVVTGLNSPHGMALLPVLHTFGSGLQMIASPEDFTGISPFDSVNQILAARDTLNNRYVYSPQAPADALHPTVGYFAFFANPVRLFDQGTATSTLINLQPGWNLIGSPIATTVPLSALGVTDQAGVGYSDPGAASRAGVLSPLFYSYSPGDAAYPANYQVHTLPNGTLEPFKGYWVYAFQRATLNVAPAVR